MRQRSYAQVETGSRKDCSFQDRCSCILRLLVMQVGTSSQVGKQRSVRRSDLSMNGTVERLSTSKLEHHASWQAQTGCQMHEPKRGGSVRVLIGRPSPS